MKVVLPVLLLLAASPAIADEADLLAAAGEVRVLGSHGLMKQLEKFMHERQADVGELTADGAVDLMVDWMRFSPVVAAGGETTEDALLYQYGGWSEGCATAFKMSLLRRVTARDAAGARSEHLAGITLMYEPSGQSELKPYSAVADAKSLESFVATIESSPAFRELGSQKPMAAMVEGGGIR